MRERLDPAIEANRLFGETDSGYFPPFPYRRRRGFPEGVLVQGALELYFPDALSQDPTSSAVIDAVSNAFSLETSWL